MEASALSVVLRCTRPDLNLSSASDDMCRSAHYYLYFPRVRYTHTFLFTSICAQITFLHISPHRGPKTGNYNNSVQHISCNVKRAWEENRISCQGVTLLHMREKMKAFQVINCNSILKQRHIQFDPRHYITCTITNRC